MKKKVEKYQSITAYICLILILWIIPLYMKDRMVMIGDAKYYLFLNYSLVILAIAAVLIIIWLCKGGRFRGKLSVTDWCVLLFGVSAVVSWFFSYDRPTAFWGYDDWHMGLLTQLLFVAIYFLISRWYDCKEWIWWGTAIVAGIVFLLGLLNKMQYDPLGIYDGMDLWDWNRANLLSTIGNINWYCGYASVVSGIMMHFSYAGKGKVRIWAMLGTFLMFATMVTQGSESGYAVLALITVVLLRNALHSRKKLMDFLRTVMLLPVACIFLQLVIVMPFLRGLSLYSDDTMNGLVLFRGWYLFVILLVAGYLFLGYKERRGKKDYLENKGLQKGITIGFCVVFAVAAALVLACAFSDEIWAALGSIDYLQFNESWGNGRGALWEMALLSWRQGNFVELLVGVGPDCFSYAIYTHLPVDEIMNTSGQWADSVYANAHNEFLNMLVNQGIVGAVLYLGIFVSMIFRVAQKRYGGILLAVVLAIAGYMANGFFSFQQVVSTPLIFAVIAMGDAMLRRGEFCEGAGVENRIGKKKNGKKKGK